MKSKLSKALREFLTAYLKWAETVDNKESQQDFEFDKSSGLCDNFADYCTEKDIPYQHFDNSLRTALKEDFPKSRHCYPFGGEDRFHNEVHYETHHKNELRLNWIKKQLGVK